MLDKCKGPIKAAAEDAIRVYDKYIPELKVCVRPCLRSDSSCRPYYFPLPRGDYHINATDVANFFGAAEGKVCVGLVLDWRTYCEKWPTIPANLKAPPRSQVSGRTLTSWPGLLCRTCVPLAPGTQRCPSLMYPQSVSLTSCVPVRDSCVTTSRRTP